MYTTSGSVGVAMVEIDEVDGLAVQVDGRPAQVRTPARDDADLVAGHAGAGRLAARGRARWRPRRPRRSTLVSLPTPSRPDDARHRSWHRPGGRARRSRARPCRERPSQAPRSGRRSPGRSATSTVASDRPAAGSTASQVTSTGTPAGSPLGGSLPSGASRNRTHRRRHLRPGPVEGDRVAEDGRDEALPRPQLDVERVHALLAADGRARLAADDAPARPRLAIGRGAQVRRVTTAEVDGDLVPGRRRRAGRDAQAGAGGGPSGRPRRR